METEGITNLYYHIILQAFVDYSAKNKGKRARSLKKRAYDWVVKENEGFNEICSLAQLSAPKVRKSFLKFIAGDSRTEKLFQAYQKARKNMSLLYIIKQELIEEDSE